MLRRPNRWAAPSSEPLVLNPLTRKPHPMRLFWALLVVGPCLLLAGCGDKHGNRPAVHPLGGKLLVAGKPAANARNHPVCEGLRGAFLFPAACHGGGRRLLPFDHLRHPGRAPDGDYAVTVIWPGPRVKNQGEDEPGPDRLEGRYADRKKPAAEVHVASETSELATIDLKLGDEKPKHAAGRSTGIEQ